MGQRVNDGWSRAVSFSLQLAFEGLKPFPKRRDIQTKQTCYLNTLKEKHKKKELQRLAFAEREQLVSKSIGLDKQKFSA